MDFYRMEPWGDWAENVRNAHIVSTLVNINRDPKKREKPYSLMELMLWKPLEREEEAEPEYQETTIAPETITWLFAASRKKNGN